VARAPLGGPFEALADGARQREVGRRSSSPAGRSAPRWRCRSRDPRARIERREHAVWMSCRHRDRRPCANVEMDATARSIATRGDTSAAPAAARCTRFARRRRSRCADASTGRCAAVSIWSTGSAHARRRAPDRTPVRAMLLRCSKAGGDHDAALAHRRHQPAFSSTRSCRAHLPRWASTNAVPNWDAGDGIRP